MRGVVSAGMVVALEQLALVNTFDAIYGSSGGAMNAAYLLAGQAVLGTSIYYENINNRSFIDFLRPLRGQPIIDLDFLVGDVMERAKRLDVDAVLASPAPLNVLATHLPSGKRDVFRSWTDRQDFLRSLRAGASMPVFAGSPYPFRDGQYWDALLSEPIPVAVAEEDGCTHVVALMTRPLGTVGPKMSWTERLYVVPKLQRESPGLAERYAIRGQQYASTLTSLWNGRGPLGRARVLPIGPAGPAVSKLERRQGRLVDGAAQGFRAVATAFGVEVASFVETIAGFDVTGRRLSPSGSAAPSQDAHPWPLLPTR